MVTRTMTRAIADADPLVPIGLQATPYIRIRSGTKRTFGLSPVNEDQSSYAFALWNEVVHLVRKPVVRQND
jgi:hypothetical protein